MAATKIFPLPNRQERVRWLRGQYPASQQRACELLQIAVSSYRYESRRNDEPYVISARPKKVSRKVSYLDVWKDPNIHSGANNVSGKNVKTWRDSGTSLANCVGVDALIQAFEDWPQDTARYNWRGPNSNSAARALGAADGFNPTAAPRSVGWKAPVPGVD